VPEKKNFVLRLDHATYRALGKWASDEFRSVNGQIEFVLSQALKEQFGKSYQERFRQSKARPAESQHGGIPNINKDPSPDR
jgi:hypothetical protein